MIWAIAAVYVFVGVQIFRWSIRIWYRACGSVEIFPSLWLALLWPLVWWVPFVSFAREALFENPPPRRPGRDVKTRLAKWSGVRK